MKKLISCFYALFFASFSFSQNPEINSSVDKFGTALSYIDFYYVDSVKPNKLTEEAIVAALEKLDPHSVYISKEELKEMNEPLEGKFEGIGIQFNILYDTITVISAISGGPSERLGILSGDKIVKIENQSVAGVKIKNDDVLKKLRGDKGTKVNISIFRRGKKDLIDYTIVRDKIPIYSIDATYMATPTAGYIKLSRFAQTSMDEFAESLKSLKGQGAKDLILDLTDNGGGYLDIAFKIADEFLANNKLIVYTEGLKSPRKTYMATAKGEFEKGRLIILVDEGSASASEIVSGAVQDWDRGLLIGRRTFGKGLVQNQFPLPDGSAMRLTIARYYTPVGRCIQKNYEGGTENYSKDFINRYNHGELYNQDSIRFPDSLKYFTPNKRVVYGGGGIMPDIFIPYDTTMFSQYLSDLNRKGVTNQFSLSFVDKNRDQLLKTYPNFNDFNKNFTVTEKLLNDLVAAGEKEGVKKDEKGLKTSRIYIETLIKAIIARDLWKNDNYFEVANQLNPSYNKALEVLKDDTFFKKKRIN
jgi:carboxyl-terminal processing protease